MADTWKAQILTMVILCTAASSVDATGKSPVVIAVDGLYHGRLVGLTVQAVFDMGGVTGSIVFNQKNVNSPVHIHVSLNGLEQYGDVGYPWHAHEYPVNFGLLRDNPCGVEEVGEHYDPLRVGPGHNSLYSVECNRDNQSACEIGDFSSKLGLLRNDQPWQTFTDATLDLYGPYSIIGRSIVIHREEERRWICANVEYNGVRVQSFRSTFEGVIQGDIIITQVYGRDDATILLDLYRNDGQASTHVWDLRVGTPSDGVNRCNFAMVIYGEQSGFDYSRCSREYQRLCPLGDLTSKCGNFTFDMGRARIFCTDNQLGSIPAHELYDKKNKHRLSFVITDADGIAIESCASLEPIQPQVANVKFVRGGIYGDITFYQASPYERTYARTFITGIRRQNVSLEIRVGGNGTCENLPTMILRRPGTTTRIIHRGITPGTAKTGDTVVLGNLAGKLNIPPESQSYRVTTTSPYLPLFGPYSIIGNTLALIRDSDLMPLACGLIERVTDYPDGTIASILGYQNKHVP